MDRLAQRIHDWAIGFGELLPGVVREQCFFPGLDDSGLPEPGKVTAQVGLVELEDRFKVTHAEGSLVKKVQDAESIRVGQCFQDI